MRLHKSFKQKIALLLVVLLALAGWPGVGYSATPGEITQRIMYLGDKVDYFNANSLFSDNEVYSVWVDLNSISTTGSVTSYTYENGNAIPQVGQLTTNPRTRDSAVNNMNRYILGDIRTAYMAEPFNCAICLASFGRMTVPTYVYSSGNGKDYAMDEIIQALPTIFSIEYVTDGGGGDFSVASTTIAPTLPQPSQPITLPVAEQAISAMFSVSSTILTLSSSTSGSETKTVEMDVAPEIINDRTYVPVRYLAYALGVPESGVQWDDKTNTVSITKDKTTIGMTIGSRFLNVNGKSNVIDVPPYIKDGRTMLPARWVAEPLGATVNWDQEKQQMEIVLP